MGLDYHRHKAGLVFKRKDLVCIKKDGWPLRRLGYITRKGENQADVWKSLQIDFMHVN